MSRKLNSKYAVCAILCFVLVAAIMAQGQGPQPNFKFTEIDNKLLADVNDFDRQLQKKGLVYDDPELNAYLDELCKRIVADQPPLENVQYKIRALRDPMINAFALPNGSIYVNTGLLAAMQDESELVSVLSHEVTHVANRHSYQNNRSVRKKVLTLNILSAVAAAGGYFPAGSAFGASLQLAGTLGEVIAVSTIFGYSQDLERNADQNALALMSHANYDAAAMPRALQRLDEKLEFEPVEPFWRTHPKLQERLDTTRKGAESYRVTAPRVTTENDYLTSVSRALIYNIRADLRSRRARTALARSQRLARWKPEDPVHQTLVADAFRSLGAKTAEPTAQELTGKGQSEDRKRYFKRTEAEEQKELLAKPGGAEEKRKNRELAEKLYLETISRNASFADAHRGLGFLYEEQGRNSDAAREYRKYLELASADAMDRLRIERRAQALEKGLPVGDLAAQEKPASAAAPAASGTAPVAEGTPAAAQGAPAASPAEDPVATPPETRPSAPASETTPSAPATDKTSAAPAN